MTSEENKRKRWTNEETLLLLSCYANRKEEFKQPRKKKFAYGNVLKDMLNQGFLDTSATSRTLEAKMRMLIQAYKIAKDNNRRTGAAPCRAPFMDELEEIVGHEATISNGHTLNLGSTQQNPLPEEDSSQCFGYETMANESPLEAGASTSNYSQDSVDVSFAHMTPTTGNERTPTTSNESKRKSPKEKYYEQKLELKKKFYDDMTEIVKQRCKSLEAVEKEKFTLLKDAYNKN